MIIIYILCDPKWLFCIMTNYWRKKNNSRRSWKMNWNNCFPVDGSCGVDEGRFSVTVGVIRSGDTVVVLKRVYVNNSIFTYIL